jgi:aminoglycoside 3-N-acetyltransferase
MKRFIPFKLKQLFKDFLKKRKFNSFEKSATHLTYDILVEQFINSGFKKGDILFVHSSLKGLGYIENGAKDIIDALKTVITDQGTLIFPTFTINGSMYDTLNDTNHVFDPKSSPSTVGAITNHFRTSKDIFRSLHPTHSVAAWGKYAKHITASHHDLNTNFGQETPFGKFLELNGKLVGLGIDYAHVTFYHVYEDLNLDKFPKVYLPEAINTKILNHQGEELKCQTLCHNSDFHKTRIDKDPKIEKFFREYFEKNDVSVTTQIGDGHLWWMHTKDLIEHLDILHKKNKTIFKIN